MNTATGKINILVVIGIAIAVVILLAVAFIGVLEVTDQPEMTKLYEYKPNESVSTQSSSSDYVETDNSFDTNFDTVTNFCTDGKGHIYVAGDSAVRIFDRSGTMQDEISLDRSPSAVGVGPNERIYIALEDQVAIYDQPDNRVDTWQIEEEKTLITSIDLYRDEVILADAGNRVVRRYDKEGTLMNLIGQSTDGSDKPQIVLPGPYFTAIVGDDGLVRVNNTGRHRIELYTLEGDLEEFWGKPSSSIEGFCGCCNPVDFTMLPEGRYLTSEKGLLRLKIYDANGNFKSVVAQPEQLAPEMSSLRGQRSPDLSASQFQLATDQNGIIYVLDPLKARVRTFEKK